MRVVLIIVLLISVVANGHFLRYYDRRILYEPAAVGRGGSTGSAGGVPAGPASGATVFDISKSAGAKGNGQADMTAVSICICFMASHVCMYAIVCPI